VTGPRYIFHLSVPVADLEAAKRFYSDVLGARVGRTTDDRLDGARLVAGGMPLLAPPAVTNAGTPQEQGKIYLADPSHNVIEIKTYRNLAATIGYEAE